MALADHLGAPDWHGRAVEVVRREWRLPAEPAESETGWSNRTWQVGRYWLTCRDAARADQLRREIKLFARINRESWRSGVRAPVVVPTWDSRPYAERFGQVWRLTEDLAGAEPDSARGEAYLAIGAAVARLHEVLAPFGPGFSVAERGVMERVLNLAAEGLGVLDDVPGLEVADRAVLDLGLKVVRAGHGRLGRARRQLLHGDPAVPNLRVDPATSDLVATLDLEAAAMGPVEFDLAAVGMWAFSFYEAEEFDPAGALIGAVDGYQRARGRRVDVEGVYLCMLAKGIWWIRSVLLGVGDGCLSGPLGWQLARYRAVLCAWSDRQWRENRAARDVRQQ